MYITRVVEQLIKVLELFMTIATGEHVRPINILTNMAPTTWVHAF